MFFKEIIGKDEVKRQLIAAVDSNKTPHAQLLLGKQGSGHLALALALSSYILCKERILGEDSCGQCSACTKSHKYSHPDFHCTFPVIKHPTQKNRKDTTSNAWLKEWRQTLLDEPYLSINRWQSIMGAENSLPDINVKECDEIVKKLGLKSYESNYKVLVLWLPEYLRKEGNRLLKLIEEPTPDTFIIMVADGQEDILNTILSRVQISKVPPFTTQEITNYLGSRSGTAGDTARQMALMADGDLGTALSLVAGDTTDYSEALFHWLRVAYKMEPKGLQSLVDEMSKWGRENQKSFFKYSLHFFREYLFSIHTGTQSPRLSDKEKQTVRMKTSP